MASWLAVTVVDPAPTKVMSPVLGSIVATDVLELVKEKVPLLVVVGLVSKKSAVPNVLVGITKSPYTGVPRSTVRTTTMLAAV